MKEKNKLIIGIDRVFFSRAWLCKGSQMLKNVKIMTSSPEGSGKSCQPGRIYSDHICKVEKIELKTSSKESIIAGSHSPTMDGHEFIQTTWELECIPCWKNKKWAIGPGGNSATTVTASDTQN